MLLFVSQVETETLMKMKSVYTRYDKARYALYKRTFKTGVITIVLHW